MSIEGANFAKLIRIIYAKRISTAISTSLEVDNVILKNFNELQLPVEPKKILFIGAGRCREISDMLDEFPKADFTINDLEFDETAILNQQEIMKRTDKCRVKYLERDINSLTPFKDDDKFDLIIFRHPPTICCYSEFAKKINNYLKKQGIFLLTEENPGEDPGRIGYNARYLKHYGKLESFFFRNPLPTKLTEISPTQRFSYESKWLEEDQYRCLDYNICLFVRRDFPTIQYLVEAHPPTKFFASSDPQIMCAAEEELFVSDQSSLLRKQKKIPSIYTCCAIL